jgi:hypothetical protein
MHLLPEAPASAPPHIPIAPLRRVHVVVLLSSYSKAMATTPPAQYLYYVLAYTFYGKEQNTQKQQQNLAL